MSKYQGVFTALVTPFEQGEVDFETFRSLCKRQISGGVAGLVPCGTTGETPTLSQQEWAKLIQIAVETAQGEVPVIAGCGSNSTAQTVVNVRQAQELGADAALVVFPYYNKPNPEGLRRHVEEVCKVGLPIVLYHVPGRTGQRLSAQQLEELCRLDNVVAIKEATGDVTLGQELVNRLSDSRVSILSGDDFTFAALTTMGFDGVISVISNPAPVLTTEWYKAAAAGDIVNIRRLRAHLLPVIATLFEQTNPIPCKGIMSGMGLLKNELRLPLTACPVPERTIWDSLQ